MINIVFVLYWFAVDLLLNQNFGWSMRTEAGTWLIMLMKLPLFSSFYLLLLAIVKLFILFLCRGIWLLRVVNFFSQALPECNPFPASY